MKKGPDLRKHFEAIIGREFVDLSDGEILLRDSTGLWSVEQGHETSREIGTTGSSTKACGSRGLFSVGGLTATGPDGKAEFFLSEHHCADIVPKHPLILVATAQSQDPVFVTTRAFEATNDNGFKDVRIEIYTWGPGGDPAGSRLIKWFCRFPFDPIIL